MALLGVWSARQRGVEVPPAYWKIADTTGPLENHSSPTAAVAPTVLGQTELGTPPGASPASALTTCFDNLRAEDFLRCSAVRTTSPSPTPWPGWGKEYVGDENPRKGVEWYYYWLYCAAARLSKQDVEARQPGGRHGPYRLGAEGVTGRCGKPPAASGTCCLVEPDARRSL